jgi:hypothetical protein
MNSEINIKPDDTVVYIDDLIKKRVLVHDTSIIKPNNNSENKTKIITNDNINDDDVKINIVDEKNDSTQTGTSSEIIDDHNKNKKSNIENIVDGVINHKLLNIRFGSGTSSKKMLNIDKPSQELNDKIMKELIEPTYYNEVKSYLSSRYRWKNIGDICEVFGKIFAGCSSVLAFSSGVFKIDILSFLAGCFGIIALIFMQFSSYSMKESKERTDEINIMLNKLGISEIPNTAIDSSVDHH